MTKFLIDNNLSPRLASDLKNLGFDTIHVRERGFQRASDEEIFKLAQSEDRVIVSADTDFGFILARWNYDKPSIILFRRLPYQVDSQLKALRYLIENFINDLNVGSIIIVEPGRFRIRKLPIY